MESEWSCAFLGDMGLTSEIFTAENCLPHQTDCHESPSGNGDSNSQYGFEVSSGVLDVVTFYSHNLAVPYDVMLMIKKYCKEKLYL